MREILSIQWGAIQEEGTRDFHVVPIMEDDVILPHIISPSCECGPRVEEGRKYNNLIWIHQWIQ